jgi:hypothetical protein
MRSVQARCPALAADRSDLIDGTFERHRGKHLECRLHYLSGNSACRRETVRRFGSPER